jgi:SAM-dependent methyltransferase
MDTRPDAPAGRSYRCRVCGSGEVEPLLDLGRMPIAHRLLGAPGEAEDVFPFLISLCQGCGLMQVVDPVDPELLYRGFNYNFSSWKPEPHRADEIGLILERVAPRSVAEIGANDGLFLSELRAAGVENVAGIEPNPVSGARARERGLAIYEGMASVETAKRMVADHGSFDLVVSRQVLEHVPDVETYFATARALLREDGHLFIDVPDMEPSASLGDCSVLWEEHVSYFTRSTLEALLRAHGFEPVAVRTYDFSGGALAILARRTSERVSRPLVDPAGVDLARRFARRTGEYGARLTAAVGRASAKGFTPVIYGAGVRACTLTNALRLTGLAYAIDDQAERQGKFLPGTHLEIRASETLASARGSTIVLLAVNNENEGRVSERIREVAGDRAHVVSVCGPRDTWSELQRMEALLEARVTA